LQGIIWYVLASFCFFACSIVVLVYIVMPRPYVYAHYVKARGDRWR
jgi:hypothetical protein